MAGKSKKIASDVEKSAQKRRTHKNKVKRYKKLLSASPEDKQAPEWAKKLDHSSKRYL